MAVRGLMGEGSVTVRRMRAFAVANEMGRGGVAVAAAFAWDRLKLTSYHTKCAVLTALQLFQTGRR